MTSMLCNSFILLILVLSQQFLVPAWADDCPGLSPDTAKARMAGLGEENRLHNTL